MEVRFVCLVSLVSLVCVAVVVSDETTTSTTTTAGERLESEQVVDNQIVMETIVPAPSDCQRRTKRYDVLTLHYVGKLTATGVQFDNSAGRENPFVFQLGAGHVIKGWDEGLLDMCVGEKRKLIIPASKGFGDVGAGQLVPPNAGLTYEVELFKIEDSAPPPNIFNIIDADKDNLLSQDEVSSYLKDQSAKAGGPQVDEQEHKEIVSNIFIHEDKDKDGFISHDEFSGPKHDEL